MEKMIVGFTGTREGMTDEQFARVQIFIEDLQKDLPLSGLHGDCVGADNDFHDICREAGMEVSKRPCRAPMELRANTDAKPIASPMAPMKRNQLIVDDCEFLLACPPTEEELKRSGTWATIRMGRRSGKQVIIVYPDGTLVEDASGPIKERVDA